MCKRNKKNRFLISVCMAVLTLSMGTLAGCGAGRESQEEDEAVSFDMRLAQMSGDWKLDLDRTDAALWESGVSPENSMEISETGEFSYYVGIGVGGTGQCEEEDGVITAKVKPYETYISEQEILTLKYENSNGIESILMDWNGGDVYWVRNVQTGGPEGADGSTEQNKAYGEILWDVYYFGMIDGTALAPFSEEGNTHGDFAIYDIDGDGCEELMLYFDGGSSAATVEYIWGFNNGNIHVELGTYPLMHYYDNGIIEAGLAHNHGLAGDALWPYTAYRYNKAAGEYEPLAAVDAWDKIGTEREVNLDGEAFPSSIDADGDGIVYYIYPDWDHTDEKLILDGKDYEKWRNNYLGNAEEITDIPFQILHEKNISKLGAPKPDIKFPEMFR